MKQNTKNRKRRLTAAEKKIVYLGGLNPEEYLYAGENDHYLFLVSKLDGSRVPAPKSPYTTPQN